MGYEVNDGRIDTWALEAHVVDHCNLRCAHCCTGSPDLPPRFVDVQDLERDLFAAARVLRPAVFKLTGGEPSLHPELAALVAVVRRSAISPVISLTTNGHRGLDDEVLAGLDALTVSRYTSAPLPMARLEALREGCSRHGVRLREKVIDRFQILDGDGADFAGCWLRHRCHMIHAGHFYLCTRPPHLGFAEDGLALDGVDLRRLLAYLEREEPLEACARCTGGAGEWRPHRQLPVIRGGTAPA